MKKINDILKNNIYISNLEKLKEYEKDRKFCKHDLEHFLSMARIAYIKVLEENLDYSKEVIYAIGLLHDIGRTLEYEDKIPHHEGSVILAKEILKEIDFTISEKELILKLISSHREQGQRDEKIYEIIYSSDKLSRACTTCEAESECYWAKEKKNLYINY